MNSQPYTPRKTKMIRSIMFFTCSFLLASNLMASVESTEMGKIVFTEGHISPSCRQVQHKENDSGIVRTFRIQNVDTDDDVSSVVLAALVSGRDVKIWYDASITSGCGTQPRINYIRLF